jgi:hypothetical protein
MAKGRTAQEWREAACRKRIKRSRAIIQENGSGESSPATIGKRLVAPAGKGEPLFPKADSPISDARARSHAPALEVGDAALTAASRILACRARPGPDLAVVWLGRGRR